MRCQFGVTPFSKGVAIPTDVVFPIIHGTTGEDGKLQGLLELIGLPYVGPDVLGSALAMDKAIAKEVLDRGGVRVSPWRAPYFFECSGDLLHECVHEFGFPIFVKPSAMGSSVGISRATTVEELVYDLRACF